MEAGFVRWQTSKIITTVLQFMFILGATLTVHNPFGFFVHDIVKELINGQLHQNDRMIYRMLCTEKTFEHISKESTGLPNHSTLLTMTRPSISSLCKIKVSSAICLKQRCMTFIITTCVLDLLVGPPYTSSLFLVIHSLLTIR